MITIDGDEEDEECDGEVREREDSDVIEIEDKTVNRISAFTLTVQQTSPNADEDDLDSDGGLSE